MREFDAYILQSFTEFGDVLGQIHILLHKISNLLPINWITYLISKGKWKDYRNNKIHDWVENTQSPNKNVGLLSRTTYFIYVTYLQYFPLCQVQQHDQ